MLLAESKHKFWRKKIIPRIISTAVKASIEKTILVTVFCSLTEQTNLSSGHLVKSHDDL